MGLWNQLRLDGRVTPGVYGCQAAYDPDDPIQTSGGAAACLVAPGTVRQHPPGTIRQHPVRLWPAAYDPDDSTQTRGGAADESYKVHVFLAPAATYKDAITGQPLVPALVLAARKLEMDYIVSKGLWAKRFYGEAFL